LPATTAEQYGGAIQWEWPGAAILFPHRRFRNFTRRSLMNQFPVGVGHRPNRSTDRRRWARGAAGAFVAVSVLVFSGLTTPVTQAADPVTINLVTINDFHGRIEQTSSKLGIAKLATAVNNIRTANPNTLFAAAGDLIGASTFTSFIQQDVPTIDGLNAAGLDVSAVGNHELDQGWDDLANRVMPLADWEYVVANLKAATGDTAIPEFWVENVAGIEVGFIGAVTDELPSLVSPTGIAGVTIEAPLTAANRVADALSDGNLANGEADIVVLLVHEGAATTNVASATDPSSRFGQLVNGANANIDAIVSGHTHLAYNHVIAGRPVISSGQYGEKFSNMTIQVDPASKAIISMTNVIVDMGTLNPPADLAIQAAVDVATGTANVLGNAKLGTVTADFNRAIQPSGENRGGESTIGNFVADVQLWSIRQDTTADIAFMNPGGLRTNIAFAPDGTVTYKEAATVQPFANTLRTLTMTGAQVKSVLEEQWQPVGSSRPFLKLGTNKELSYIYDPLALQGNRITQVLLNGVEIDPAAQYKVVANSFLAGGGDNFVSFTAASTSVDSGKIDLQSMVDWFAANGSASPDSAQRAVGVHLSAPDADGYDVGDSITIDISSLDFSTNETPAGLVRVSLGGVDLGTLPVDRTLLAAFDEIGRASVTTTIPIGLAGPQDLLITVPTTGTTATLTIELNNATVDMITDTIKVYLEGTPGAAGVTNALKTKLVKGQIGAFINQVNAKCCAPARGKGFTSAEAANLIALANNFASTLP